jgi:hypothetical protein
MSITQENGVDLHNVGSQLTVATTVGWKRIVHVKNTIRYHYMTAFPLVALCKGFRA